MRLGLLAGATGLLLVLASAANAGEVEVRAPFTNIRIQIPNFGGPGVRVNAPYARVRVEPVGPGAAPPPSGVPVRAGAIVPAPGGEAVEQLGAPTPVETAPALTPVPPVPQVRVPTHKEFGRSFKAKPGNYEVVLLHPDTRQPVQVKFTLPDGYPKVVRIEDHELEFDYGSHEVEIRFRSNGAVKVYYND